jgi:hypothetical protein
LNFEYGTIDSQRLRQKLAARQDFAATLGDRGEDSETQKSGLNDNAAFKRLQMKYSSRGNILELKSDQNSAHPAMSQLLSAQRASARKLQP